MASAPDYEFTPTCVAPFITDETMDAILESIRGARRYALQRFRPQVLLDPSFFPVDDPGIGDSTLEAYRIRARAYVEKCVVR